MSYNLTFTETSTNLLQVIEGMNSTTEGYLGAMILLLVAIITFIAMKNFDTKVAVLGSSFVSSVVALFLFMLGFIGVEIFIIPIIILFISIFYHAASQ